MTGPEHYRTAERLLMVRSDAKSDGVTEADIIAAAQVHATLALAAAGAMSHIGMNKTEEDAWFKAVGIALGISGQQR